MRRPRTRTVLLAVLALAIVLAGLISVFASTAPDGLERVARDHGLAGSAKPREAISGRLPGPVARVGGVLVVLALAGGTARLIRRRGRGE